MTRGMSSPTELVGLLRPSQVVALAEENGSDADAHDQACQAEERVEVTTCQTQDEPATGSPERPRPRSWRTRRE